MIVAMTSNILQYEIRILYDQEINMRIGLVICPPSNLEAFEVLGGANILLSNDCQLSNSDLIL